MRTSGLSVQGFSVAVLGTAEQAGSLAYVQSLGWDLKPEDLTEISRRPMDKGRVSSKHESQVAFPGGPSRSSLLENKLPVLSS